MFRSTQRVGKMPDGTHLASLGYHPDSKCAPLVVNHDQSLSLSLIGHSTGYTAGEFESHRARTCGHHTRICAPHPRVQVIPMG